MSIQIVGELLMIENVQVTLLGILTPFFKRSFGGS